MKDTKAEGEGVLPTLLHYLVHILSDNDALHFREDVSHLQAAAKGTCSVVSIRVSLTSFLVPPYLVFTSVKEWCHGLLTIKEELARNTNKEDPFNRVMQQFIRESEPVVNGIRKIANDTEERLKQLILYYGEDPNMITPEEFFDIIATFSSSFEVNFIHHEKALFTSV